VESQLAPKASNAGRFDTTNQSSYVKPSGFGQIGRRVMKNRDGTPALGYDAATYEFGIHEKPSTLTDDQLRAQLSSESFETDVPVTVYTQMLAQGAVPSTTSTNVRSAFARSSRFTADVRDTTAVSEENPDDRSSLLRMPGADLAVQGLLTRLRTETITRNGNSGIANMGRLFRIMDDSGDKRLSPGEFSKGLADYGIQISRAEVNMIFAKFDADGSGSIVFDEFLLALANDMTEARRKLVEAAYAKLDKDGSGQVTRADIEAAYDVMQNPDVISGKITPEQAFTQFMAQWETDKVDGIVTLDEFMKYYHGVSASVDRDDYFELMIRNAWHMGGGKGVSENTTCRRVLVTFKNGTEAVQEIADDLGIGPKEFDKMRARLHRQGVHGVVKIANSDGSFMSWKEDDEGGGGGGSGK
jgi:Ca2+-binding EF-hand superfamily protein